MLFKMDHCERNRLAHQGAVSPWQPQPMHQHCSSSTVPTAWLQEALQTWSKQTYYENGSFQLEFLNITGGIPQQHHHVQHKDLLVGLYNLTLKQQKQSRLWHVGATTLGMWSMDKRRCLGGEVGYKQLAMMNTPLVKLEKGLRIYRVANCSKHSSMAYRLQWKKSRQTVAPRHETSSIVTMCHNRIAWH